MQLAQESPQQDVVSFLAQVVPLMWNPLLHVSTHIPPVQLSVPPVTVGHVVHESPQHDVVLLAAHIDPLTWNPLSHITPQEVPSHVAFPFMGGSLHIWQEGPQQEVVLFGTQVPVESWLYPMLHLIEQVFPLALQVAVPFGSEQLWAQHMLEMQVRLFPQAGLLPPQGLPALPSVTHLPPLHMSVLSAQSALVMQLPRHPVGVHANVPHDIVC